jgi:hypothetical protein
MTFDDLRPTWPTGFDHWELVVFLILTGLLKLYRGSILLKNSEYIDRLGWSIISWDFLLGAYAATIALWSFYPETYNLWWQRAIVGVAACVAFWQALEVRIADRGRVTRVMGSSVEEVALTYPDVERRLGPPDRRGYVAPGDY